MTSYKAKLGRMPPDSTKLFTIKTGTNKMTRINIVPVQELSDQHAMAEYREIFMVGSSLQRTLSSKNVDKTLANIPAKYTLNKGHVTFFYDKGHYLAMRYAELTRELKFRGYNLDGTRVFKREQWPDHLYNLWTPTVSEMNIARARIRYRISQKPEFYTWTKRKPLDFYTQLEDVERV